MKITRLALAVWVPLAGAAHLEHGYTNDFGRLIDGAADNSGHTCVVLRSVEWFANSLVDEAYKISSKDGRALFLRPKYQDSPLAVSRTLSPNSKPTTPPNPTLTNLLLSIDHDSMSSAP